MGLAFKCDRCGKYFEADDCHTSNGVARCTLDKYGDIKHHDLAAIWCPKCMTAFEKFKTDRQMENRPTIEEILEKIEGLPLNEPKYQTLKKYVPNIYKVIMLEKEGV